MKRSLAPAVTALALLTATVTPAGSQGTASPSGSGQAAPPVPAQVDGATTEQVVSFDPDSTDLEQRAVLSAAGVTVIEAVPEIDAYVVRADAPQSDQLLADTNVAAVDRNLLRQPFPNDPLFSSQANLAQVGWEAAFNQCCTLSAPPNGAPVAVIDTGVDSDADDLDQPGRVPICRSYIGGDCRQDDEGHGTAVASVIAADTDDGVGVAGISPNSPIYGYQVCDPFGCPVSAIVGAIVDAVNDGADVINMSLGGPFFTLAEMNAVRFAFSRGVVVVASAGNDGLPWANYPAGYRDTLSVAAVVTGTNSRAPFSSWGPTIDLTAPGTEIVLPFYVRAGSDDYASLSGTSFSGPHVSGIAALLRSANPSMSAEEVRGRLLTAAIDIGPTGWDQEHGFGVVNALAALDKSFTGPDSDGDRIPDTLDGAPHDPSRWPVIDLFAVQSTGVVATNAYRVAPGVFVFAYLDAGRFVLSFLTLQGATGTNWNAAYTRSSAYEYNRASRVWAPRVLHLALIDGRGAPDHVVVNLRTTDDRPVSKFTVTTAGGVAVTTSVL
ncbi:MAG: hypothetical protein JJLCMIEE_00752 [Acidimicrobiales bacterium]|nr:MAG: hypothetical protein EDR02_02770 [Actinomycetota bacterium]MBV6507697.1 hypothetical protein [Acidimicrobiales bacterium]RIK07623.1 MAG: hypothetical protein DCC48_03780 [Acidobacteriota bacterium]